jgi:hypothetical protein
MWIVDNAFPFLSFVNKVSSDKQAESIDTFDFSTLYTKIPHQDLKEKLALFVEKCFSGAKAKYLNLKVGSWSKKNP